MRKEARAAAAAIDRQRKAGAALPRFAGIPVSVKDLFDVAGDVTRGGLDAARRRAARGRRLPGGGAAARGGLRDRRPHQHDRIRLFRPRPQSALRHAAQSLRPRHRPHSRRLVVRRRRLGDRRHGLCGRSAPIPAARAGSRRPIAASPAGSRPHAACRSTACCRCPSRSTRSAASRHRSTIAR